MYGCTTETPELKLNSSNGVVNLKNQVAGNWNQVCLITPYTSAKLAANITGLDESKINDTGIEYLDTIYLLAFIGASNTDIYTVKRSDTVFVYSESKCFNRENSDLVTLNKSLKSDAASGAA